MCEAGEHVAGPARTRASKQLSLPNTWCVLSCSTSPLQVVRNRPETKCRLCQPGRIPIYTTPSHPERGAPTAPASGHIWHSQRSYRAAHSDHLRRTSYCLRPRLQLPSAPGPSGCTWQRCGFISSAMGIQRNLSRRPQLTALLKSIEREQHITQSKPAVSQHRQALSLIKLRSLRRTLDRSYFAPQDKRMFWAAFVVAFHGLLRVSEYTSPSPRTAADARSLRRSNVVVGDRLVTIQPRQTKTSQLGSGGTAILRESNDTSLCLVRATKEYAETTRWPNQQHPFFLLRDGKLLTPRDINTMLHRAFGPNVASHSLPCRCNPNGRQRYNRLRTASRRSLGKGRIYLLYPPAGG